jgi:hypothetical protein
MTSREMKIAIDHCGGNRVDVANGDKLPTEEPMQMTIRHNSDNNPIVRLEEPKSPAQILQKLTPGEGDHIPVAYIEHDGTIARIDRWCWRGDDASEHETSLELVFLETNFAFHPTGTYQIELNALGVEHLLSILSAALPVMKKVA